jgi:Ca2+-binding EF-hand superfamily protein
MKRFSYACVSAIATCVLAYSPGVVAADQTKTVADFKALDANSDGKVSLNEATEHDGLFVSFKNLDKDKDGTLTKDEFDAYRLQRQ